MDNNVAYTDGSEVIGSDETTGRLHRLGCDGGLKGSHRPGIHGHDLNGNCLIDQSTVTLEAWIQGGCRFRVTGTPDQLIDYSVRSGAEIQETEELRVVEDDFIGPLPLDVIRLLTWLYPECEHGLSLVLCGGPQHWYD